MNGIERRAFKVSELRVQRSDGETPRIVGHAAVFGSLSEELWGFREKIAPGAFAKSITADVRALFNHDPNFVLGRTKSGTLRLSEDQVGLAIEADAPDTQLVRDLVLTPIERGDISQMSFGFRTIRQEWDESGTMPIRTLLEVELYDVSPVTFPAYPDTDVAVRSLEAWRATRAADKPETMDPDADGKCMDGYDMGEDGKCHLMSEADRAARASLDIRRRRLRLAGL